MKKTTLKTMSLALCATLLVGGSVGATVYANNAEKDQTKENTPLLVLSAPSQEAPVIKDETVYILTDAAGATQKIIVSDWLKNVAGAGSITDMSDLLDVETSKGNETWTKTADGSLVWGANGSDVYYQGRSEQELPIRFSVTYTLDGKNITPQELAGKSGTVSIRFDYENKCAKTVYINGKAETVYVPFAALTGMLLDANHFTNVSVANGKLVNDGDHLALVGITLPGMQESLGISADRLELPSYFEVTANVQSFELPNTITVVTNEVFNKLDTTKLDSADSLTGALGELTSAMSQLMGGSDALYEGLSTLLEKSGELTDGITALSGGLKELTSNNDALTGGSREVFLSLLSLANNQIAAAGLTAPELTIDNYGTVLDGVIASLSADRVDALAKKTAKETVTAAVNEKKDLVTAAVTSAVEAEVKTQVTAAVKAEVTAKVTAAVRTNVEEQVLAALNMTKDSYTKAATAGLLSAEDQAKITGAIDAKMAEKSIAAIITTQTEEQMNSAEVQAIISAKTKEQMNTVEVKSIISAKTEEQISLLIEQNMASDEVAAKITAAKETAKAGAESLKGLKAQLDSYNEFYTGLAKYTAGVSTVYAGVQKMEQGAPALIDGITALQDGAKQLSDGLVTFNEQGIQKLVDAVDGNLTGLFDRIKAVASVSSEYKSFSGLSDTFDGQVKFIYRTEAVSAEK